MYDEYPILGQKIAALSLGDYLEFGCGSGGFLAYVLSLNQSLDSITAVDINAKSVELARAELSDHNTKFIVQEQLPLDIPDENFSTITLSNTLHHLRDKPAVLAEFTCLLSRDGKLILTEMVSDGLSEAEQTYLMFHSLRAVIDSSHDIFHDITYTVDEILEIVSATKMRIIDQTILPNEEPASHEESEIKSMIKMVDDMIANESHLPDIGDLTHAADQVKHFLRTHGIKRPKQLYLELAL